MTTTQLHKAGRNVLVIVLETASPPDLRDAVVLVVVPALNSRLRHWLSDEDDARRKAGERADACVERLRRNGVRAFGQVGDPDPVQAIADALPLFPADEIVIAAHDAHADDLVARARRRFRLPVRSAQERVLDAA